MQDSPYFRQSNALLLLVRSRRYDDASTEKERGPQHARFRTFRQAQRALSLANNGASFRLRVLACRLPSGARMNHETFRSIRVKAGLTQRSLAALLRISDSRTVRKWEAGERPLTGPVSILMGLMEQGRWP